MIYKVKNPKGYYDVYEGTRHIQLPEFKKRGLNIDHIPVKQISQPVNQPTNQGYYKVKSNTGYDVFNSQRQHITLPQFKQLGLNIDHIPEKTQPQNNQTNTQTTNQTNTQTNQPQNNQNYYKTLHPNSNYYDVYDQNGQKLTLSQFKQLGLNVAQIPEKNTGGDTGTTGDKYKDFLLKQIEQQNQYLKDYIDTLKKQPNPMDIYKQYSKKLGLPQQQQQVAGIQKQVLDVEGLLNKLEGDVNSRISGHLVTEAQRRRELATEGKPLRTQLADLMRAETRAKSGYSETRQQLADMLKMYNAEQAKQEKIAELPLEYGYKSLPYYKEAMTYESPATKTKRLLTEKLATEKALKEAGVGRYYKAPTQKTEPTAYKLWKLTNSKMSFGDWYKNVYKSGTNKTLDKSQVKNDAIAKMQEYAGADGYVSPDTYKAMKVAWRKKGFNVTVGDFDKLFGSTFVNPTHPTDYGYTQSYGG